MSMFNDPGDELMTEINMTPLIDVMLVLLIVFMVTLPVIHHDAVKINLPQASSAPNDPQPASVSVAIDSDGGVMWDNVSVDEPTLNAKLAQASSQADPPALEIYADRGARYEMVARVLSAAQNAGLSKLRFVTDPDRKAP